MNKNHDNNQSRNRLSVANILESIFDVSLLVIVVCRHIPEAIGNIITPVCLVVSGIALLTQAALWICSTVKKKKIQMV